MNLRNRQQQAMVRVRVTFAILLLFALTMGSSEIALHGFSFFTFRPAGVGQTPDTGLSEAQGPGQPNANGHHGCIVNSAGTCFRLIADSRGNKR
jgi:hypothetical protein